MAKKSVQIDEKLHAEVTEFCKINGIKVTDFCNDAVKNWLQNEKFGDAPFYDKPVIKLATFVPEANDGTVIPHDVFTNAEIDFIKATKEGKAFGELSHPSVTDATPETSIKTDAPSDIQPVPLKPKKRRL